jgi:hypothetical protein
MRHDDKMIFETYTKVHSDEQLDEGLLNQAVGLGRAALAGGGQALKGLANKAGSAITNYAANKAGSYLGVNPSETPKGQQNQAQNQKGNEQLGAAKTQGKEALIKSLLKSHKADINKLSTSIINDLNKFKLNPKGLKQDEIQASMLSQVYDTLNKQLEELNAGAAPTPAPAPEAPTPAPAPEAPAAETPAAEAPTPEAPAAETPAKSEIPEKAPINTEFKLTKLEPYSKGPIDLVKKPDGWYYTSGVQIQPKQVKGLIDGKKANDVINDLWRQQQQQQNESLTLKDLFKKLMLI